MIFKKALIFLCSLGVVGSAGTGIYYSLQEDRKQELILPSVPKNIDDVRKEEPDTNTASNVEIPPHTAKEDANQQVDQDVSNIGERDAAVDSDAADEKNLVIDVPQNEKQDRQALEGSHAIEENFKVSTEVGETIRAVLNVDAETPTNTELTLDSSDPKIVSPQNPQVLSVSKNTESSDHIELSDKQEQQQEVISETPDEIVVTEDDNN